MSINFSLIHIHIQQKHRQLIIHFKKPILLSLMLRPYRNSRLYAVKVHFTKIHQLSLNIFIPSMAKFQSLLFHSINLIHQEMFVRLHHISLRYKMENLLKILVIKVILIKMHKLSYFISIHQKKIKKKNTTSKSLATSRIPPL